MPDWAVQVLRVVALPAAGPLFRAAPSISFTRVQFQPSAYSHPIRVVLRGPLGFTTRPALTLTALMRRTQSGRLSTYLLYIMIALPSGDAAHRYLDETFRNVAEALTPVLVVGENELL